MYVYETVYMHIHIIYAHIHTRKGQFSFRKQCFCPVLFMGFTLVTIYSLSLQQISANAFSGLGLVKGHGLELLQAESAKYQSYMALQPESDSPYQPDTSEAIENTPHIWEEMGSSFFLSFTEKVLGI